MISNLPPLIKEHRVMKLLKALLCFDKYAFDRNRQRECILKIYPKKSEKSVFRGMVIPSLRKLGLIVGYGQSIRLSANGKLIVKAYNKGKAEALRVLRVVFLEIDSEYFRIIEKIAKSKRKKLRIDELQGMFFENKKFPMDKKIKYRIKERIESWVNLLKECNILSVNQEVSLTEFYDRSLEDLEEYPFKKEFISVLIECYKKLISQVNELIDIEDIRREVGIFFYEKRGIILTEKKFDHMLSVIPHMTKRYIIHLGRSMGAEEKLFFYKGKYYRTLSIILEGR